MRRGEPFRGTLGPEESFERVAFSTDSRRLISGGDQQYCASGTTMAQHAAMI